MDFISETIGILPNHRRINTERNCSILGAKPWLPRKRGAIRDVDDSICHHQRVFRRSSNARRQNGRVIPREGGDIRSVYLSSRGREATRQHGGDVIASQNH